MSAADTPEVIGKALVVGVIAMVAWSSAPALAVAASAASCFCAGRWIVRKWLRPS
jgi:hypothetical protein